MRGKKGGKGPHPFNTSSLKRKDSPRGTAPRLRGDGALRAFLPVLPGSRETLRKGRCRVKGAIQRCCQPAVLEAGE